MAVNSSAIISGVSALVTGIKSAAGHPVTKGGALGTAVTIGLYAAQAAGLAIPGYAFVAGPIAGVLLYKMLPKKIEDEIDATTEQVVKVVTTMPETFTQPQDFPQSAGSQAHIPLNKAQTP